MPGDIAKMQPKVSMVMPCFNKAAWIGGMFDSIIAQKWDNIELILVNDGSTDGTREVIENYLPKFSERGFEVVVIDQENRGVGAAVLCGLKKITGEYVCQVDADDKLDPAYVSTMAGWLCDHQDYDWAICDFLGVCKGKNVYHRSYFRTPEEVVFSNHMESYLLSKCANNIAGYMTRTEYIKRSGLIENYYHNDTFTQEPQYAIPLIAAGGRLKHFPIPLYHYVEVPSSIMKSCNDNFKNALRFYENRCLVTRKAIESLNIESSKKMRFLALADIRMFQDLFYYAAAHNSYETISTCKISVHPGWIHFVNSVFTPSPNLSVMDFHHQCLLFTAVADTILNFKPRKVEPVKGRIIAWGLGERSRRWLPCMKGTYLEPLELWDSAGDGAIIKKPEPDSLTEDDMVFIFPGNAADEIYSRIKCSGCDFMFSNDITHSLAVLKFPQFYDDSIVFTPEAMTRSDAHVCCL